MVNTNPPTLSRNTLPEGWELRDFGGQLQPFESRPDGDLILHRMVPMVRAVGADEDEPVIEIVGSAQTVDSYETVFVQRGMDDARYKANPVFLRQHAGRELPLGMADSWRIEEIKVRVPGVRKMVEVPATIFRVRFDVADTPEEDDDWQRVARSYLNRYRKGFLRGASIGFRIPRDGMLFGDEMTDKDRAQWGISERGIVFKKWELTELSAVSVPSNMYATKRSADGTCNHPELGEILERLERIEQRQTRSPAGGPDPEANPNAPDDTAGLPSGEPPEPTPVVSRGESGAPTDEQLDAFKRGLLEI